MVWVGILQVLMDDVLQPWSLVFIIVLNLIFFNNKTLDEIDRFKHEIISYSY